MAEFRFGVRADMSFDRAPVALVALILLKDAQIGSMQLNVLARARASCSS